ncbi:MAG: protein dehydratase [Burkholderiales bacterium]|nr:MAG: protein dehydratase [Burkholderiales bacterium]
MNTALDLTHLRQWIGREVGAEDVLTLALALRFHATLGLAGNSSQAGEVAPQLIHFCLCQPAAPTANLGEDGHPARGGFLPPVPLPRRMWAASQIEFHHELRVGDTVRRTSRIADVTTKSGRSGTLCFVAVDHELAVDGAAVISERQTIVYRDAPKAGPLPVAAPEPAAAGAVIETIDASSTLLFRYSALTFNAHRIHYDRTYSTGAEGYPGLVVHGPLQASLLIQLATRCRGGRPPRHFAFRGAAPAFEGRPLSLHAATSSEERLELWTAQGNGPVSMLATAHW